MRNSSDLSPSLFSAFCELKCAVISWKDTHRIYRSSHSCLKVHLGQSGSWRSLFKLDCKTQSNFNSSSCKSTFPLRIRIGDAHCKFRGRKCLHRKFKSSGQNQGPLVPCQLKFSCCFLMSSQTCQTQKAQKMHSFNFPPILFPVEEQQN